MPHSRETINLPIFPIHGVLFPGMRLQLYMNAYLEELVRLDMTLSVALVRPSREADTSHEPHLIGTTARIVNIVPTKSREDVILAGISRIHLLSYRHNGQHLVGQARFLPDLQESIPALLVEEARALGSELASTIPGEGRTSSPTLPKEPETLSYWIAQHLPIDLEERQELLELRTTSSRLSKEVSHMRVILDAMRSQQSS